jgi:hypothetical protein
MRCISTGKVHSAKRMSARLASTVSTSNSTAKYGGGPGTRPGAARLLVNPTPRRAGAPRSMRPCAAAVGRRLGAQVMN